MSTVQLVVCPWCRSQLVLPPGNAHAITCGACRNVVEVAPNRAMPYAYQQGQPSQSSYSHQDQQTQYYPTPPQQAQAHSYPYPSQTPTQSTSLAYRPPSSSISTSSSSYYAQAPPQTQPQYNPYTIPAPQNPHQQQQATPRSRLGSTPPPYYAATSQPAKLAPNTQQRPRDPQPSAPLPPPTSSSSRANVSSSAPTSSSLSVPPAMPPSYSESTSPPPARRQRLAPERPVPPRPLPASTSYAPSSPRPNTTAPVPPSTAAPTNLPTTRPQGQWRPARKRALIIGINYEGQQGELGGCVNDARCMRFLLKSRFGFKDEDILMLTEDNPNRVLHPTRKHIITGFKWLVEGNASGDSLFFSYSGHGSQKRDLDGDEIDGLDETILPLDHRRAGQITDDDINEMVVRPIVQGCRLHAVIDACHSGSVLDLPFHLQGSDGLGRANWIDERRSRSHYKGTSGGEVVCFSACDDNQVSADTTAFAKVTRTGAMTYLFIEAIESGHGESYASILSRMNQRLASKRQSKPSRRQDDFVSDLLSSLLGGGSYRPSRSGLSQVPQLSAAAPFDIQRSFLL